MTRDPQKVLVAIVDDERLVRTSLRRLCGVLGFETADYPSGRDFIAALDYGSVAPDCVLLDAHMPDMTGLEVHQLLAIRHAPFATIIFTADDAPETRARYLAAGVSLCLRKPANADLLVAAIEEAVAARPHRSG